mgnify:CR=1 FL=1
MFDPDCRYTEEQEYMESYMEKVREKVLNRLSPLEVAALFEDLKEFIYRWREEQDIQRADSELD